MREMRARRVQLRFARLPEEKAWPAFLGPQLLPDRNGLLSFDYAGELRPLLEWLSRQALDDVRIEPSGLGPVYHKYHGSQV